MQQRFTKWYSPREPTARENGERKESGGAGSDQNRELVAW